MGHKHSRETLLAAAVAAAREEGLHRLSFGRVGARAGTSDRVVVYYFPTKDDLVLGVLDEVGAGLLAALAPALDGVRAPDHLALAGLVWSAVRGASSEAPVAIYVEALGLAAAGSPPYVAAAATVAEAWTAWFAEHLVGTATERRAAARGVLAVVDGLLLVRLAAGAEAADEAARALGVA